MFEGRKENHAVGEKRKSQKKGGRRRAGGGRELAGGGWRPGLRLLRLSSQATDFRAGSSKDAVTGTQLMSHTNAAARGKKPRNQQGGPARREGGKARLGAAWGKRQVTPPSLFQR